MPRTDVVRDPIHGMIRLRPEEWRVVDTPTFQRLRSVRQLAMTHLVYPGTTHSRFEHSIGVRHIVGRLAAQLGIDGDELRVVECAALLHDVGHGPFSHVSEQVVDERAGARGVHEAVSAAIIRTDDAIRSELGAAICDRAADLVSLRAPRSYLRDIVSGPTDADKLDYLLRPQRPGRMARAPPPARQSAVTPRAVRAVPVRAPSLVRCLRSLGPAQPRLARSRLPCSSPQA
jgi:HD superfamily phosphohydrolase